MLSLGKFPTQVQFSTIWQNFQFSPKSQFSLSTHLNFHPSPGTIRNGFFLNALKTQKKGEVSPIELDEPDDFDDEFWDVEVDEFEDDEDDEVDVPLKNMKKWVENRPRGFGEGKVYDTSVEDKLMEEIEHIRVAQLANVNNLKNNPGSTKETSKQEKASANIQEGFRVRLVNLPKKKNIHRDLGLALKGVPGLLNIVPVVAGNEKTRDPICKGIAFLHFKYEDEAHRFVQSFSGQMISFGKVQKKVTCEMVDSKLPKPSHDPSVHEAYVTNQQALSSLDKHLGTGIKKDISVVDSQDTSSLEERYDQERPILTQSENVIGSIETSCISESNVAKDLEAGEESTSNSSPLNQGRRPRPDKKKVATLKRRKDKSPKLSIPGSSNRLKIRDKALLTDVFSKYGSNATLTVKEQSR